MTNFFVIQEAIHSVSLEHADDCDCTTCRAADGDADALDDIFRQVAKNRRKD